MSKNNLAFDSFENLKWEVNDNLIDLLYRKVPQNRVLETFKRINELPFTHLDINFSDNIWDFSSISNLPIPPNKLKFIFKKNNPYNEIHKFYILSNIFRKITKIRNLNDKSRVINKFLIFAKKQGYIDFKYIPYHIYNDYLENLDLAYNTFIDYKRKILDFIKFYENNFCDINDQNIKSFLKKSNYNKLNAIKEANKTPEIPEEYIKRMVQFCKNLMMNENVDENDRINAAIIILYSQIGFRTGELLTIKANSIKEKFSPENEDPLRYLEFFSYKNAKGENGVNTSHSIVNNLSFEAFKILNELCEPYRKKMNSPYLFVTKYQRKKMTSPAVMMNRVKSFILRYGSSLDSVNTQDKYPDLNSFKIDDFNKIDANGYRRFDLSQEKYNNLTNKDYIIYPKIHQFRVTVCNQLYRQGVPLSYIKKHMNHLSIHMTSYYIRPEKNLEKEYSKVIYTKILKGKSKLLGKYNDEFIDKIEEFIENIEINYEENMDNVIEKVSKKFPLRKKHGGICIKCGSVIPCASNDATDEILCAFEMCPNHCHMFFMADISYEKYLEHKELVEFNIENGFEKAAQKEKNKIQYMVENSLLPELNELEKELDKNSSEEIILDYPQLTDLVNNYNEIYEEVSEWI